MSSAGSTSVFQNDMELYASGVPANQFGIFFYGPDEASLPLGDGTLCVGAGGLGLFRLPVVLTSVFGIASYTLDYTQPPLDTGSGAVMAGTVMNFQHWYRDPLGPGGTGFNLSNGYEVVWQL